MSHVLLTIGIPTRNRAPFLRDLLDSLTAQIQGDALPLSDVEILVSDNASTDDTPNLLAKASSRLPHLRTWRQAQNIGAQGNYHGLVDAAAGRFVWIIGDDDIVLPGALKATLDVLRSDAELALLIHFEIRYDPRLPRPSRFASYRDYIRACAKIHPHALVEHTLTTSNIYRADRFDRAFARANDRTDFPHMYGMGQGLKTGGGAVLIPAFPGIRVRDQRAPAVDGIWPTDLERSWIAYLSWMQSFHDVPELDPGAAIDHIRRELLRKITRHPIRFVRDNLASLRQPTAWWWFLKRLIFHSRGPRPVRPAEGNGVKH